MWIVSDWLKRLNETGERHALEALQAVRDEEDHLDRQLRLLIASHPPREREAVQAVAGR